MGASSKATKFVVICDTVLKNKHTIQHCPLHLLILFLKYSHKTYNKLYLFNRSHYENSVWWRDEKYFEEKDLFKSA